MINKRDSGGIVVEMTLRQEALEKIALLPEASIRVVLAMVDEMLRQNKEACIQKENSSEKKKAAFKALVEMREKYPFPDVDFDEARRSAMEAKYGRFA